MQIKIFSMIMMMMLIGMQAMPVMANPWRTERISTEEDHTSRYSQKTPQHHKASSSKSDQTRTYKQVYRRHTSHSHYSPYFVHLSKSRADK